MKLQNKSVGACAKRPTANLNLQGNYVCRIKRSQGRFNKSGLALPVSVLGRLGIAHKQVNAKGYWVLRCPFHKDGQEKNPSLNVHYINGHYRCHTCGEKGGDILAFYMAVTGKKFFESACELGAWEIDYEE